MAKIDVRPILRFSFDLLILHSEFFIASDMMQMCNLLLISEMKKVNGLSEGTAEGKLELNQAYV